MSGSSATDGVLGGLDAIRGWQEDFYRSLHEHPELSHQEQHTAAQVAERLGTFGYEVHEGIGGATRGPRGFSLTCGGARSSLTLGGRPQRRRPLRRLSRVGQ